MEESTVKIRMPLIDEEKKILLDFLCKRVKPFSINELTNLLAGARSDHYRRRDVRMIIYDWRKKYGRYGEYYPERIAENDKEAGIEERLFAEISDKIHQLLIISKRNKEKADAYDQMMAASKLPMIK